MTKGKETWAVGRRKTSVARVKLVDGTGKITINKKDIKEYIQTGEAKIEQILAPLETMKMRNKYDVYFNVKGGGVTGQVGALRHALARVLTKAISDAKPALKKEGFLTRDSRMVERKKYGLHKARRGTQFSKR
ncbi:MAG: 30S ribosomal protein S9 [Leptospiraceae bacterium]|nr:30S ribosomal protein S9 [Leptospiraceae bacterium]MCP5512113.1 30S ribosomal protein S9 [Leptospiraceae bacterium]